MPRHPYLLIACLAALLLLLPADREGVAQSPGETGDLPERVSSADLTIEELLLVRRLGAPRHRDRLTAFRDLQTHPADRLELVLPYGLQSGDPEAVSACIQVAGERRVESVAPAILRFMAEEARAGERGGHQWQAAHRAFLQLGAASERAFLAARGRGDLRDVPELLGLEGQLHRQVLVTALCDVTMPRGPLIVPFAGQFAQVPVTAAFEPLETLAGIGPYAEAVEERFAGLVLHGHSLEELRWRAQLALLDTCLEARNTTEGEPATQATEDLHDRLRTHLLRALGSPGGWVQLRIEGPRRDRERRLALMVALGDEEALARAGQTVEELVEMGAGSRSILMQGHAMAALTCMWARDAEGAVTAWEQLFAAVNIDPTAAEDDAVIPSVDAEGSRQQRRSARRGLEREMIAQVLVLYARSLASTEHPDDALTVLSTAVRFGYDDPDWLSGCGDLAPVREYDREAFEALLGTMAPPADE